MWLEQVTSTMEAAHDLDLHHGDAVATLHQTAGRGRLDREWIMRPGRGLALSLVLEWETRPRFITRIPLLAAIALRDVVRSCRPDCAITVKWPNDVLVNDLKLAGILVDARDSNSVIVGMGVNTGASAEELPIDTATSLELLGIHITAELLAEQWRHRFLEYVSDVDSPRFLDVHGGSIDTIGRVVRVSLPGGGTLTGMATGIGDDGSLELVVDGETRTILAGDVTHLRHETRDERR